MRRLVRVLLAVQHAAVLDENSFSRLQVTQAFKLQYVQRDALRRHHVIIATVVLACAEDQRTNTVRVAERDNAEADNQCHHGIAARAALVDGLNGAEHLLRRQLALRSDVQFVREHVQQHLGVVIGAQVTSILARQQLREILVVGQVAVVRETDAVRRIDVKRLGLRRTRAARRRIADMANTDVAAQSHHVAGAEHVAHETVGLALLQAFLAPSDDTGAVLTAMLHDGQGVIDRLVDRFLTDYSNNAAHSNGPLGLVRPKPGFGHRNG